MDASNPSSSDEESDRNAIAWRGVIWIGLAGFLIAFLLQGRVDGSDTSHYLEASQSFWGEFSINADSWFQIRAPMSALVGLCSAPFGWAMWSWTLSCAIFAGIIAACSAYAIRVWLPELSWRSTTLLSLAMPGVIKSGAMLYPDAAQAALLSLGLLMLFRPNYQLPRRRFALLAGLLFGVMIGVNPTSLRFGIIVMALAAVWYRRIESEYRVIFMRRAGLCAMGVLVVLLDIALVHWIIVDEPLLLFKQLHGGGIADAPADQIDGLASLKTWVRGAFGPWGEFGLYGLGAAFGLFLGRTRMKSDGQIIALVWFGVVLLTIAVAILPQVFDSRAGAGEFSTRYVIPAAVPIALLAGSTMAAFKNKHGRRRVVLITAGVFCAMALLFNHKPRFFTDGPEDAYAFLLDNEDATTIYATPRQAKQLTQLWDHEVTPLEDADSPGVAIISARELALLKRKYGKSGKLHVGDGFQLAEEIAIPEGGSTLWQSTASWLDELKRDALGREPLVARSRVFRVVATD